jgi:Ca2+-binding RTX toxin-like protein
VAQPTAAEQLMLEYINAARLDPLGDAARYISSYGTIATSADPDINAALSFFQVSGPALLAGLSAFPPVDPLAWSDALSNAARAHNAVMIQTDTQTHQAPGEPGLGARLTAAGYNFTTAGENVFAFGESPLQTHAAFMVDWGVGPDGMQSPAGHRISLLNGSFREIGIAIDYDNDPATDVGPEIVTQDLGARSQAGVFILGVAYGDADGDRFYSIGEGRSGLSVTLGGVSVSSGAAGGYALESGVSGAQTVVLSGAGLAGTVSVALNLASGDNVKLDVVDGTILKTSASATVSGPISALEGLGARGLTLRAEGVANHTIQGGSGSDTLSDAGGTNYLRGGAGNDSIIGGSGFDDINGNQGDDTCVSGGGDDWVVGGKDNDSLIGSAGHNLVYGNLGSDTCEGGAGNDIVRGGQGDDIVRGGDGDDFVSGDRGDDTMSGGAGADIFHTFAETGLDRVLDFSVAEGDRVQLAPGTQFTVAQMGADTVISMTGGGQMILVGVQMSTLPDGWIFGA